MKAAFNTESVAGCGASLASWGRGQLGNGPPWWCRWGRGCDEQRQEWQVAVVQEGEIAPKLFMKAAFNSGGGLVGGAIKLY